MENIRLFTYNKGNFVYVELCSFICVGGVCTHAYKCVGMGVYTKLEEDTGTITVRLIIWRQGLSPSWKFTVWPRWPASELFLGRCLSPAGSTGITSTGSRARIFTMSTVLSEPALPTCLFCFMND